MLFYCIIRTSSIYNGVRDLLCGYYSLVLILTSKVKNFVILAHRRRRSNCHPARDLQDIDWDENSNYKYFSGGSSMNCPMKSCFNSSCITKTIIFGIFLALALIIWGFHLNKSLFFTINSLYPLLSSKVWTGINFIAYSKHFILPGLLLLLTVLFKRDKLIRVIILIVAYYVVFYCLKKFFGEARPFVVLAQGSFNWLNSSEPFVGREFMSFPSGHTGLAAIFVFALNRLFFANRKVMQFILFLFLVLVSITRIVTGWHWPLDVIASGLIAYLLVQICFYGCNKSCGANAE